MKNSLCNSVSSVVKKLLEYGEDGTPVYVNELTALNQELRNLCADLLLQKGESPEEEAEILVSLFKGYDTMLFNFSSENEQVIQELLDRSMTVLEKLPASVSPGIYWDLGAYEGLSIVTLLISLLVVLCN